MSESIQGELFARDVAFASTTCHVENFFPTTGSIDRDAVVAAMENSFDDAELPALARLLREIDEIDAMAGGDLAAHVWYEVPRCTCPKTLNARLAGQSLRMVAEHCSVHAQLLDQAAEKGARIPVPMGDGRGNVVAWMEGAPGVRWVDVTVEGEGARVLHMGEYRVLH